MQREDIQKLPIYPEQRLCTRPTTEQILRLFSLAERHTLLRAARTLELTDLQRQVIGLIGVPRKAFAPG